MTAIHCLRDNGFRNITVLAAVSILDTMNKLGYKFPDVTFIIGALDSHLSVSGYIIPGVGDIGDRLHGIKSPATNAIFDKQKMQWKENDTLKEINAIEAEITNDHIMKQSISHRLAN